MRSVKVFRRSRCSLFLLPFALMIALAGCEQISVSQQEQIANRETIIAGTPSATATFTPSPIPSPTLSPTATLGPSPTPSATPFPTATPLPPTPTPNPALRGFSFCDQTAGEVGAGRFSARLTQATTEGFPAFERLIFTFEPSADSAPLSASASCLSERDYAQLSGDATAPGPFVLQVDLPDWLHDDAFRSSAITQTLSFTTTRVLRNVSFRFDPGASAGATLNIALDQPLPYRLALASDPFRLVVEVARTSPLVASSDMLTIPAGGGQVQAPTPFFFRLDGDIWQVVPGPRQSGDTAVSTLQQITPENATAINLTQSAEVETDLAVRADGKLIAFCRATAGVDPAEINYAAPSSLWVMNADGSDQRQLASVGRNCADPAFSLDGSTLAFSVDETGATPVQRSIWTVSVAGGVAERVAGGDEWSRFTPHWLADGSLVYAAAAEDGRSTLFLQRGDSELDIGADLLLDAGVVRYNALTQLSVSRDGRTIAVEASRADLSGADLLVLDTNGTLRSTIGAPAASSATSNPPSMAATAPPSTATNTPLAATNSPEATTAATRAATAAQTPTAADTTAATSTTAEPSPTAGNRPAGPVSSTSNEPVRPFWTRPVAWGDDGTLYYLTTLCSSSVVQEYALYGRNAQGDQLIATGTALGGLGSFVAFDNALAYVAADRVDAGARGLVPITLRSPTTLWFWELDSGRRGHLLRAERGILELER